MTLSGKLWPIHLKPQNDELLSSWLVRLAKAHNTRPHTFTSYSWPDKAFWNRDIDKLADSSILAVLAERTATPFERVFQTTLRSYEGRLYEKHNSNGNTQWIMPLGIYHRTRTTFGLQYCPECLKTDSEPYFRKKWRLAFMTVCERHCVLLEDRCPNCNTPVNFHRNSKQGDPITLCSSCRFDLRKAKTVSQDFFDVVNFELMLLTAIEKGWLYLPGRKPIYAHLYFLVLRLLMRLLSMKHLRPVRNYIEKTIGFRNIDVGVLRFQKRYIEEMNIPTRIKLTMLAGWLVADWPYRFVHFCKSAGVTSARLVKDMEYLPYWYLRPIQDNLYHPDRHPSDEEIFAAIGHLKKSNLQVGPHTVSRILGGSQIFRKSKKSFAYYLHWSNKCQDNGSFLGPY